MDIALLHNPKAGSRDATRQRLERALKRAGYRPRYFNVHRLQTHPEAFEHGEFTVVAGGDGSVRKAALRMIGRGHPLALLPLGTANNIAHSLGVTGTVEEIIAGWGRGRLCPIDVGVAKGPWGVQHFLEGVGLGLLGRAIPLIDEIDRASSHVFGSPADKLHRDLCVFIALGHEAAALKIGLRLNAARPQVGHYILLEVLNIARAGPQLELVAAADPSDGYLDVVAVPESQRARLDRVLRKHLQIDGVRPILPRRRARSVRLTLYAGSFRLDDHIVWTAEAEQKPATVEISLLPGALSLLLPGPAAPRRASRRLRPRP